MREREEVHAGRAAIGVGPNAIQALNQKLEGAAAIALIAADETSPTAVLTALELARNDEAEMLHVVQVTLSGCLPQPPVRLMNRDGRLKERIDFIDPTELRQALDRFLQIGAGEVGLGFCIERQATETLVRVLVIPRGQQLVKPFAIAGPFGAAAQRDTNCQHRAAHQSDDDQAEKFHGSLEEFEPLQAILDAI